MAEKLIVEITVSGPPGSYKSRLISEIASHLQSINVDVEINWGIDGSPAKNPLIIEKQLTKLRESVHAILSSVQTPKKSL